MTNGDHYAGEVPYAMPIADQRTNEFEKWRFDIEDILIEKEYNLLGYFWDKSAKEGEGAWVAEGEARVNKIGAKAIITAMGGTVNKISVLTQLNIDEILMEVKMLAINLNRLFFLHHEKYGLTSPSDAQDLLWQLVFFALNGLKQSEGAASMKAIAEAGRTMRHIYIDEGQKGGQGLLHIPRRKKE